MLKIILMVLIAALPALNCSDSGRERVPSGFIAQDFTSKTPLSGNKAYSFINGSGINAWCAPSTRCSAVYYSGTVGNTSYTGIAADARMSGESGSFNIMIYKGASDANYTVKVLYNHVMYSNDSVAASLVNIVDNGDSTVTVTFTGSVPLGTLSIGSGDFIVAQSQN